MKFDNTNSLNSAKTRSKSQKNAKHVIGVRIDTKAKNSKNKVYYYSTDGDYKRGDVIRARVPSGGKPKMTIAIEDSKKNQRYRIKELKEVK